jgi:hypothetical protein
MSTENVTTALQAFATTGNGEPRSAQTNGRKSLRHTKTAPAQGYCRGSRCLCNARPTFEPIITRRKSRRPIFQPKRQKATPTSMKHAILSTPCTICPLTDLKNACSLTLKNPVIAPRMMVPIKQKSITCPGASKKTYHCLVAPDARAVLKPAREGNTPPKLHLVSTVDNEPKFPKKCRIILRYNRRAGPRTEGLLRRELFRLRSCY